MPNNSQNKYQGICFACNSIFDLDRPYAIGDTLTCPICGKQGVVVAIWWIHRLLLFLRLGWRSTGIFGSAVFERITNIYVKLIAAIVVIALGLYSIGWAVSLAVSVVGFIIGMFISIVEIAGLFLLWLVGFVGAVVPLFFTIILPLLAVFGVVYALLSGPTLSGAQAVSNAQQNAGTSPGSSPFPNRSPSTPPNVRRSSTPLMSSPDPDRTTTLPRGNTPSVPSTPGSSVGFPGPMNISPNVILRNQNRTIALLLIMIAIMGMIIILCFLSHRTGESFQDLSKQLLGYNAVNIIIFFALFSGIKLAGARFGYKDILRSPRSLATFLLYAILLGTSNAIVLVIIDSLIGDLEGDLTSNIALILYGDLIVGIIVMLFLERSFSGWKEDFSAFTQAMGDHLRSMKLSS